MSRTFYLISKKTSEVYEAIVWNGSIEAVPEIEEFSLGNLRLEPEPYANKPYFVHKQSHVSCFAGDAIARNFKGEVIVINAQKYDVSEYFDLCVITPVEALNVTAKELIAILGTPATFDKSVLTDSVTLRAD